MPLFLRTSDGPDFHGRPMVRPYDPDTHVPLEDWYMEETVLERATRPTEEASAGWAAQWAARLRQPDRYATAATR